MIYGRGRFELVECVGIVLAFFGILATSPLLLASWLAIRLSSKGPGFFRQARVGRHGCVFQVLKLRTMYDGVAGTTVTKATDERITPIGRMLRRTKIDELPQLVNVLRGEMTLVGPRPDVRGFADQLAGRDRIVLAVLPGHTGPATLLFSNEEELLAKADDPEGFNRHVLFPLKTAINCAWIENGNLYDDVRLLCWTIVSPGVEHIARMINRWDPEINLDQLMEAVRNNGTSFEKCVHDRSASPRSTHEGKLS